MSESLKQNNNPSSAAEGLKSLETRIGFNPTVREQFDTVENFKENLKQCKIFLDNAKLLASAKNPFGGGKTISTEIYNSSTRMFIFIKNIDLASELLMELKNSKSLVTGIEKQELQNLIKFRNDMITGITLEFKK